MCSLGFGRGRVINLVPQRICLSTCLKTELYSLHMSPLRELEAGAESLGKASLRAQPSDRIAET